MRLQLCVLVMLAPAADAAVVRTAKPGPWSAAATWDGGKLPAAGDKVLIRPGHVVVYDMKSDAAIRSVTVGGTLTFAPDRDTKLVVGLIKVQAGEDTSEEGFDCEAHAIEPKPGQPRPTLSVGTPERPIEAKSSAVIRLASIEGMNKESCPAIVCCGGKMEFHGAAMSRTWVKLGTTAKKGDVEVALAEAVSGWRVGDRVIVTSTDNPDHHKEPRTEERTIKALSGSKLTLDRPLSAAHLGDGEFRGEVANLSRNVVVESADPEGNRGHTMYHKYSAGSISYAEFRHLGKKNVLGRYALHYHLIGDTMRGSSVVGASIWDSHNRWLTIHGTNYLVVRDCVGYKSVGHGYFFEDGTEVYNVLDRNLAVGAVHGKKLPKQVLPFDQNDGAGFWWSNSLNTFTRNVACENDRYGFRFEATQTSAMKMTLPVRGPDGKRTTTDIRTLPFVRFDDNEAHGDGLYGINIGEGVNRVGPDAHHPFVMRRTKIWSVHYAFRPQSPSLLVEGMHIWQAVYGVYHPNYDNHVYRDMTITRTNTEPFNRGHDDLSVQHGTLTVDGLTFDGIRSGGMPLIQLSDQNPTGKAETHFRNLKTTNWAAGRNAAMVNLGGGPRPAPTTPKGVPVYVHDYFGPGRHAKVMSTKSKEVKEDGLEYRTVAQLTGDQSRAAEVKDVPFPKLLDPVDDLPPTTVITAVRREGGQLVVSGTSADNGVIKRVVVGGVEVKALTGNYATWEATVPMAATVSAHAEDEAGNVEKTPHVVEVR